jgi:PIN domain nuclease of toxin-antitoxin system
MNSGILLDTHIWIWFMEGDKSLKPASRRLIDQAAQDGSVYVSSISFWEIAVLEAKERIKLARPCLEWIQASAELLGLQTIELTPKVAVESYQLPGDFHGDPADRIITASARVEGLTLMTKDKAILKYAKQHHVQVVEG